MFSIPRSSLSCILIVALLSLTAALDVPVAAQTTPTRPAVRFAWVDDAFYYSAWPVDLNKDGRSDIVGATGPEGSVVTALGNGDGSFQAALRTSWQAVPVGVGDFDNDGSNDVVLSGVAILQGNGDGTFVAAHPVTGPPAPPSLQDPTFSVPAARGALIADFDGDGLRDLALINPHDATLSIHPNHGSFLFGTPTVIALDQVPPRQGIVADFNGDGRRDIVVVGDGPAMLLLNDGGFSFSTVALLDGGMSVTAGDVNRDSRTDLVFASLGSYARHSVGWGGDGAVGVALGNGDGTFQRARWFTTGKQGVVTVVVGDFNKDGLLDAATGNRSWISVDRMCGPSEYYSDSITILAGRGDGTLGAPAAFRSSFRDDHNALKTSDFNGDGRTDLLASPGGCC